MGDVQVDGGGMLTVVVLGESIGLNDYLFLILAGLGKCFEKNVNVTAGILPRGGALPPPPTNHHEIVTPMAKPIGIPVISKILPPY